MGAKSTGTSIYPIIQQFILLISHSYTYILQIQRFISIYPRIQRPRLLPHSPRTRTLHRSPKPRRAPPPPHTTGDTQTHADPSRAATRALSAAPQRRQPGPSVAARLGLSIASCRPPSAVAALLRFSISSPPLLRSPSRESRAEQGRLPSPKSCDARRTTTLPSHPRPLPTGTAALIAAYSPIPISRAQQGRGAAPSSCCILVLLEASESITDD
uniref:Uncharacterized protein n=1 Tax=Oryza glumipatula TaxID=40148 RepID=A0A0E0AUK5_9ORYZ